LHLLVIDDFKKLNQGLGWFIVFRGWL